MKVHAPKARMLSATGDFEADLMIHAVKAAKKLEKERKKPSWLQAQATATNRRLLIGNCKLFRPPR